MKQQKNTFRLLKVFKEREIVASNPDRIIILIQRRKPYDLFFSLKVISHRLGVLNAHRGCQQWVLLYTVRSVLIMTFPSLHSCDISVKTLKQPQALSSSDRNTDFEPRKGVKSYNNTKWSRETLGNQGEQQWYSNTYTVTTYRARPSRAVPLARSSAQSLVKYTHGALRHSSVTAAQASSANAVHVLCLCCMRYLKTRGTFWRRNFKVTRLFIINLSLKKELNTLAPTPASLINKTFYKAQSNFWAGRMAVWPAQAG